MRPADTGDPDVKLVRWDRCEAPGGQVEKEGKRKHERLELDPEVILLHTAQECSEQNSPSQSLHNYHSSD